MQGDFYLLRRLWPFIRKDRLAVFFAIGVTPVVALCSLAQPWLLKQAIDQHIVPGDLSGLDTIVWSYVGVVIGMWILEGSFTLALAWSGTRSVVRLRAHLYEFILARPQQFFDDCPAGVLLTRVTSDLESLGEVLAGRVVTILLDILVIIGVVVAMFSLNAQLTTMMLLMSPPLFVALNLLRKKLKQLFLEIRNALSQVNAFLAERIDGVQIVQLFSDEARTISNFDKGNLRFRNATTTANAYDAFMFALVDGVGSIFIAAMLWFSAVAMDIPFLKSEAISVGLLIAFIDYLNRLFRPLRELSGKIAIIQRAVAALIKIFGLLDDKTPTITGDTDPGTIRGELVIKDVSFAYRDGAPDVIRGINLRIKPGDVLAIVGASGSGKTTLTRLLDRSFDGYRGSITLDDQEISGLNPQRLRRQVISMRQDIQIFSETVQFNVDLGNESIEADVRRQAVSMVHANRIVEKLGWEYILRERGSDLSVGEGQLLTFARTMAHDPTLIILDEATASVDSLTESLIQDAIARILSEKTVIVIAHRLSTIQRADWIAVMEQGEIVEQGTHQTLLDANGVYADLVHAGQSKRNAGA